VLPSRRATPSIASAADVQSALAFLRREPGQVRRSFQRHLCNQRFACGRQVSLQVKNLYVFVYNLNGDGINRAHGANPKLIGRNLLDLKDADGTAIVRGFLDIANNKGSGWFDYKWPNPVNGAVESKSTYVERVDDVFIGCGIYK
jgi:cytochrome c